MWLHPWSIDILSKASLCDGAAALRRQEIKAKKYLGEILPQGSSPSAVPLVFELFGQWGEKALKYLDDLSHLSRDESGQKNPANFKLFWRRCLSVELQKCNASVMSRKAYNIIGGQKCSSELDTFQFFVH